MQPRTVSIALVLLMVPLTGCFGEPEDEDGLTADAERSGWTVTVTDMDGETASREVTSDPHEEDTDRDGIDDFQEMFAATDPRHPDTDGDRLKDGHDVELAADSDLAKEWLELDLAHERAEDRITFFGEHDHQADPVKMDADSDGLSDGDEVGGFPTLICDEEQVVRTSPRFEDSDDDHLSDARERRLPTDPNSKDTDGDGVDDLTDVQPCGDLWVRFEALTFTLRSDEVGPFFIEIRFDGDPVPWQTDPFEAESGEPVDLSDEVPSSLDVEDGQGNLRDRDFNITLTVFAYAGEGDDRRILDLTGDGETLVLQLDVRSRTFSREGQAPGEDAGIVEVSGDDARLRIGLAPQIGR